MNKMRAVRPPIHLTSDLSEEEILKQVGESLRAKTCPVAGVTATARIELHVLGSEEHLWSPQLVVNITQEAGCTHLRGDFGPHPSVWTLYMAGYALCVFSTLVGSSFAYAQWVMGEPLWALLSLPLAAISALCLYLLAFFGQHAGSAQMDQLRNFLEADLARHEALSSRVLRGQAK